MFRRKKGELVVAATVIGLLLLVSSCFLFFAEHGAQPDRFSSIPATMWWSVTTLTTVGYGDMYPVTTAGRLLGSVVAILGVGMFALPTGILGAGFVEQFRSDRTGELGTCPHCGKRLADGSGSSSQPDPGT